MSYSKLLLALCFAVANFAVSGCGSGDTGTSSVQGTINTPAPSTTAGNSYTLTEDTFGLQNANFLAATNENGVFTLRAAIAVNMTDPNFTDVFRIDILQPAQIYTQVVYPIGGNGSEAESYCDILFFNGEKSTYLDAVSGTVTFTSFGAKTGDLIAGSFAVQVVDTGSALVPQPVYTINGNFGFVLNMPGAIN